jgi:Tol biopolymer transport system component
VTNDPTDNQVVAWLDDERLAFSSSNTRSRAINMFVQVVEGAANPQRILESDNDQMPGPVDADGRLLFFERSLTRSFDSFVLDLKTKRVEPLLVSDAVEGNLTFSQDKKWIAYQSDESGRFEVYVQDYPRATTRKQVSKSGGTQPVFSRDGTKLFFRDFFGAVWAVSAAPPNFGTPTRILDPRDYRGKGKTLQARTYDVANDGRFLMVKQPRQDLVLVVNWVERLKKLLPAR